MLRTQAIISLSGLLALMSGCAGMSEQACLATDWQVVGFEDGAAGRPVAAIGRYRQQCADHGISPDLDRYRAGHADGLESFCRPGRGFDVGRRGVVYQGVCPVELEAEFLAAYQSGRYLYELETEVRRIDSQIAANNRAQEGIREELTGVAATIANSETSSEERIQLVARAAELGRRHGELSNENETLAADRAAAEADLLAYRETLAFGF